MRRLLVVLIALAGCGPRARPPARPARSLKLVVLVVIDQLPMWSFSTRSKLLTGGIARLLREGTYYSDAEYPYAATLTAPGHAALGTGAPPAASGIINNEWWRRDAETSLESVADASAPLLSITGTPGAGASPRMLRVPGVADALLAARPGARVVGVSLKDRAAMLPVGQHPTLAVWYDPAQLAFTTSTYYASEPPGWLRELAREHPIAPRMDFVWQPRDPALYARESGPDDAPGEPPGLATFPHKLAELPNPPKRLRGTPLGNQILTEAALAALRGERLGQDDIPDLLTISFSGHDLAGHFYGQESWETLDMLLDTDQRIGELLAALDREVGAGRYAVVLTSDHGVTRLPERSQAAGRPAGRITIEEVESICESAAAALAGPGDWVANTLDPYVYLTRAGRELAPALRARVLAAMTAALRAHQAIGYAEVSAEVAGDCAAKRGDQARMCLAIDLERAGEILYDTRPDYVVQDADRYTTTHGTLNPDDRTVPIIVFDPRARPRRHPALVSPLQVAPTLAALLGVAPPAGASSQRLP